MGWGVGRRVTRRKGYRGIAGMSFSIKGTGLHGGFVGSNNIDRWHGRGYEATAAPLSLMEGNPGSL